MDVFIIDAVENASYRIAELADTACRDGRSGPDTDSLPAAICLPIGSVLRPVSRTVSDGTGDATGDVTGDGTRDGTVAALIVVREVEVAGIRGVAGFRFGSTRRIAASCYKVCRDGFESFGTAGIAELGGKMGKMASAVGSPYVWYVGTHDEIADAFSYLIPNLKTVLA